MVKSNKKVRVNITVDEALLEKTKRKLNLFGGKLSTLFNSFLFDFVNTMKQAPGKELETLNERFRDLEERVGTLEKS